MTYRDMEGRLRRKARKRAGFVLVTMRGDAERLVGKYVLVPVGSGLELGEVEQALRQSPKGARPLILPFRDHSVINSPFVAIGAPRNVLSLPRRRRGRVAEGGGLLNRYTVLKPYPGFESLRLRHFKLLIYNQPSVLPGSLPMELLVRPRRKKPLIQIAHSSSSCLRPSYFEIVRETASLSIRMALRAPIDNIWKGRRCRVYSHTGSLGCNCRPTYQIARHFNFKESIPSTDGLRHSVPSRATSKTSNRICPIRRDLKEREKN